MEIIKTSPIFKSKIWGGSKLSEYFTKAEGNDIGEAWLISGHREGPTPTSLNKTSLKDLWNHHPELFGYLVDEYNEYPLLTKIIDAKDDLSVQVHPNNEEAKTLENESFGKTECWLILEAEEDAEIIYGVNNHVDVDQAIENNSWDDLLVSQPVSKNDFVFVPAGTVHAIGKGIVLLEIQQSSDITYRFYDYNRKDHNGKLRDLHIEKSKAVMKNIRFEDNHTFLDESKKEMELIDEKYFKVTYYNVEDFKSFEKDSPVYQVYVKSGQIKIQTENEFVELDTHENAIISNLCSSFKMIGNSEVIISFAK